MDYEIWCLPLHEKNTQTVVTFRAVGSRNAKKWHPPPLLRNLFAHGNRFLYAPLLFTESACSGVADSVSAPPTPSILTMAFRYQISSIFFRTVSQR